MISGITVEDVSYLVDPVKNSVAGGATEGPDHLPEDDHQYRLRCASGHRGNRANQHQRHVLAIRVLEQLVELHPTIIIRHGFCFVVFVLHYTCRLYVTLASGCNLFGRWQVTAAERSKVSAHDS